MAYCWFVSWYWLLVAGYWWLDQGSVENTNAVMTNVQSCYTIYIGTTGIAYLIDTACFLKKRIYLPETRDQHPVTSC